MPKRKNPNAPYWQQMRHAEKSVIEYALEHGVTVRGTAKILGIASNYLYERMRLLEIAIPEVRSGPKPGTRRPQTPKLRVVPDGSPPEETLDEDEDEVTTDVEDTADEGDVLEDEVEEGSDDDEEGDAWDDEDEDAEDEDDGDDEGDASAQGN